MKKLRWKSRKKSKSKSRSRTKTKTTYKRMTRTKTRTMSKKIQKKKKPKKKKKLKRKLPSSNDEDEEAAEPAKKKKKRTYDKESLKQKETETTRKYVKRLCTCLSDLMDQEEDESSVKNCQRAMRYMYKLTLKDKNLVKPKLDLNFLMKSKAVEIVKHAKKKHPSESIREAAKRFGIRGKRCTLRRRRSRRRRRKSYPIKPPL